MSDVFLKIKNLYPELKDSDFSPFGDINLQDNADGLGAFIAKWNHPTLAKPTDEQLKEA
jgi:hypothetical protein